MIKRDCQVVLVALLVVIPGLLVLNPLHAAENQFRIQKAAPAQAPVVRDHRQPSPGRFKQPANEYLIKKGDRVSRSGESFTVYKQNGTTGTYACGCPKGSTQSGSSNCKTTRTGNKLVCSSETESCCIMISTVNPSKMKMKRID